MSVIKITVDEQNLHITDSPKIAAQGVNENYVLFTFSPDWDGFAKVALFYADEDPETVYQSLVDANGSAVVPWEVTNDERKMCIGVSGVKDNVVKTSEILKYKIVKGLYVVESSPPSPGIYEQMLTAVEQINESLANAPYLYYEEDEDFELPVHTINDSEIANTSTWSSAKIIDMIYPVGAIFMSTVNTNPSVYLGGTWVSWGTGRVPVAVDPNDTAFNTVEKTGGEKTHTLTINEIPSHTHQYTETYDSIHTQITAGSGSTFLEIQNMLTRNSNTTSAGGGTAHNNLQPYITCYMFKRTA